MNRYLLNFSYVGTRFRGLQKQIDKNIQNPEPDKYTVQGCIENAFKLSIPTLNEPELTLSSRTDKGVHALSNYAHVDLETKAEEIGGKPLTEDYITKKLNRKFLFFDQQIRILQTIKVPDTFHCRFNAKSRTYLYRIALRKNESIEINKDIDYLSYIPIDDGQRCWYFNRLTNIEVIKENVKLFQGYHDFRTFMSVVKSNSSKQDRASYCLRYIRSISIDECKVPPIVSYDLEKASSQYKYYDITITGTSFLYKQVRRIVGTLVALGAGIISKKDVYEMITIPSKYSWHPRAILAPPFGLYLCDVHYDKEDFKKEDKSIKN